MDTRNGRIYESPDAAREAGVPEEFILEVFDPEDIELAQAVKRLEDALEEYEKKSG